MLENMSKEELISEVGKLREELYHLKMAKEFNLSPTAPRPDGYATPGTRTLVAAPDGWAAPFTDSEVPTPNLSIYDAAKKKINAVIEKIIVDKKEAEEADKREYSGWCLRITDFEGLKFLYLKSPDDRSLSLEVDTSEMVNNIPNRPQVLFQFANALGTRDIPGVWPRWWKLDRSEERFVITCGRLSYTITPKFAREEKLLENFFNHLQTIRVRSIDEVDGA